MAFADVILKKRMVCGAVIVIITGFSLYGAACVEFDDNAQNLFRTDNGDWDLLHEVYRDFGTDDRTCFLLVSGSPLFSPQSVTDLRRLTNEIRQTDGVSDSISMTSRSLVALDSALRPLAIPRELTDAELKRAKARAMEHPLTAGRLLSESGDTALIKADLRTGSDAVDDLQSVVGNLRAIAKRWSEESSLQVQVTGIPAVRVEAFNRLREQTTRYTILGAGVGLLMAVFLMRRLATIFVVCSGSVCGALWTTGALGLYGEQITVLTTVLPMLVLIIGLTDSVHLAFDIRASRAENLSPLKATQSAVSKLALACLLTSVTTAVGFASLYATQVSLVQRFGLACAAGCGLTFLAIITVVPWLSSTRLGNGMLPPQSHTFIERKTDQVLQAVTEFSLRHRRSVSVCGLLLCVVFACLAVRLTPENQMSESLPDGAEALAAIRTADEEFGGIMPSMIVADWPEGQTRDSEELHELLREIHSLCDENDAVNYPFSVINLLDARKTNVVDKLPQSAATAFINDEQRRAVVFTRTKDAGSAALTDNIGKLQRELKVLESEHPGFRVRMTGFAPLATIAIQTMISDLASSLGIATIVIFGTMAIAFRSLRIGLICLLPNALPLLITAGLLAVFDGTLRFASVIVFSVCLGVAVDDTIHMVTRFHKELRTCGSVEQALRRSVRSVGAALVVTTGILTAGLSIPITSDIYANRIFGILSCFAVLAALPADLILLPALLAWFIPEPEQPKDSDQSEQS